MIREKVKAIEILSPGKNLDYAKEVIRCGADAVYIGAPKHSMRIGFTNSLSDIQELIEFAHKYWVKVYVTVNSLLYTNEDISQAKQMITELYHMKADGIIISDLGILELDLPPIPIIISVSTMCDSKEYAKFLQDCGVSKIVLSRQLSYEQIKEISENTLVPLEMFCYGFYCVGKDGNCYMSYLEHLLKTNSCEFAHYHASNYGFCPERCMGNWTLYDANGNIIRENDRLMNLRYLSYLNELEELVKLGVESFKIAGREKDLKHAKNSTALFAAKANEVAQKLGIKRASSGKTILGFKPSYEKNFNKGFSNMFFAKRKKEMYSKYTLIGQYVGKIVDFKENKFKLDSDEKLHVGDRLRYKIDNNPVETIEIIATNGIEYEIKDVKKNLNGLDLYRYIDVNAFNEVVDSVNYRVISVTLDFDEKFMIAEDEDNNKVKIEYKKGIKALENPKKDFYELNHDCEFVIESVNCKNKIYIDDINKFKETIFSSLRKERELNRPILKGHIQKNTIPFIEKNINYLRNANNEYSQKFLKRHCVEKIEPGIETMTKLDGKRILTSKYCLRYELDMCSKYNRQECIPPLPWEIKQLESGINYNIEFDCKNCEMNFYYKKKVEVQ